MPYMDFDFFKKKMQEPWYRQEWFAQAIIVAFVAILVYGTFAGWFGSCQGMAYINCPPGMKAVGYATRVGYICAP